MNSVAGIRRSWEQGAASFLHWWGSELWGLVPERLRARMAGQDASIVIAPQSAGTQVLQGTGDKVLAMRGGALLPTAEAAALAAGAARVNSGARVGIRLQPQDCFRRSVELPVAARADAAGILDLDLERSTPFKLGEVYTAAYVEGAAGGGKVKAVQLVVKRSAIDPILDELRASGLTVAFVDCWAADGQTALPVNFLAAREPAGGFASQVTVRRVLTAAAVLLAVTAVLLALARYQGALDDVQGRVAETRAQATTVRRALDGSDAAVAELARLQRRKLGQIPVVEVIEELTKLLPDSVWIADLRLEGDALDISGLARSGATLLPLFERSKLFTEASLTAPLTFDQQEDKERFSLRVRVRQPDGDRRATVQEQR